VSFVLGTIIAYECEHSTGWPKTVSHYQESSLSEFKSY